MGTLAHVLEAEGLATVALGLIRGQAERLHPPRMLVCEFPLGRPLGRPNDPDFQTRVLRSAFAMLSESSGPVLLDFPETIEDSSAQPLVCQLPPRLDTDCLPAVDEARGLRRAWQRNFDACGRTLVGRAVDVDGIVGAIEAFARIAGGTPWKEAGVPGHPLQAARDITSYYEEAAAALSESTPAARSAETWFYHRTEAGRVLLEARRRLREADAGFWFYLVPFTQDPG